MIESHIVLNSQEPSINVSVRYSNKAKHIAIRIKHDGPELVLPNKNLSLGRNFLLKKESWIRKKLKTSIEMPINQIPIFEKKYFLEFTDATKSKIEIKNDIINIHSKPLKHRETFIKFLQKILLEEIIIIAELFSKKHNLNFSQIKISDNKSKWGSCNSKAVIRFNWRLIFAPKEILKYLVAHEMAHLKEMNHSKNFWQLVEKLDPSYKDSILWLKKNGRNLHRYLQKSSS